MIYQNSWIALQPYSLFTKGAITQVFDKEEGLNWTFECQGSFLICRVTLQNVQHVCKILHVSY
jgi:hypothetical protein